MIYDPVHSIHGVCRDLDTVAFHSNRHFGIFLFVDHPNPEGKSDVDTEQNTEYLKQNFMNSTTLKTTVFCAD
jgi:hypothetical protein